jgi:hypothetical protein
VAAVRIYARLFFGTVSESSILSNSATLQAASKKNIS